MICESCEIYNSVKKNGLFVTKVKNKCFGSICTNCHTELRSDLEKKLDFKWEDFTRKLVNNEKAKTFVRKGKFFLSKECPFFVEMMVNANIVELKEEGNGK